MIDIEALLDWTYRVQRADLADRLGTTQQEVWEGAMGGAGRTALASSVVTLGVRVDTSAAAAVRLHPDAEAVHCVVTGLPRLACGLLIQFARTGGRPEWAPGARVVETYARNDKGQPIRLYDGRRHFIGYKRVRKVVAPAIDAAGQVVERDTFMLPEELSVLREVWSAWWSALALAADRLAGVPLVAHYVCGPSVAAAPWELPVQGRDIPLDGAKKS